MTTSIGRSLVLLPRASIVSDDARKVELVEGARRAARAARKERAIARRSRAR